MKQIVSIALILILGLTLPVFAQDSRSGADNSETTVEELYLRNMELRIIREQAVTLDRDMKLLALKNIQEMMDNGKVSDGDPETHYVLDYLANEGIGRMVRESNRLVNNFPVVRKEACALLGQLGGDNSVQTLLLIMSNDDEPMVLSEAAYSLGLIGDNEDNRVSQAIADAVLRQDTINPSDNFAYAALLSFQKLAAANSGLRDPEAVRAVIAIAQGNYIREVKIKANDVLNEMRKY
ncbi:MAG: HEAT repeat domain-containing protein [Spirochaetales bacterium]|nr:HEAT repeat domain-containing protein [Spirochaetales bacterium]